MAHYFSRRSFFKSAVIVAALGALAVVLGAPLSYGGLVQHWAFDDGTGATATNSVAGGNAGTLVNFAGGGWDADKPAALPSSAGSLTFSSASGQYVDCGALGLASVSGVDGVTVALWIKPGKIVDDMRLWAPLRQSSADPHPEGSIRFVTDAFGQGTLQAGTSLGWADVTPAGAVLANRWQHLCCTWQGNKLVVYLNGSQVGSVNMKFEFDRDAAGDLVRFGVGANYLFTYGTTYDGKMDDLSIWNTTLSPEQIRVLALGEPRLLQYWTFDDGAGATATNAVADGNAGTLVNFGGAGWDTDKPAALPSSAGSLAFSSAQGQYVDCGALGLASPGGGDGVTVALWIKPGKIVVDMRLWAPLRQSSADPHPEGSIRFVADALGQGTLQAATSLGWVNVTTAGAVLANQWQHLGLTWRANLLETYVNGSLVGRAGMSFEFDRDAVGGLIRFGMGANYLATYGTNYDGKIDDLTIWNKTLSSAQIGALASGESPLSSTLASASSGQALPPRLPLAEYRFDGNTRDSRGLYDASAVNGVAFTNGMGNAPFDYAGNMSLQFDGMDDEVTLPNVAALRPGTNAWSLSLWFKAASEDQDGSLIANRLNAAPYSQMAISVSGTGNGNPGPGRRIHYFVLGKESAASGRWESVTTSDYADGGWHHVALVHANDTFCPILYVDGGVVPFSSLEKTSLMLDNNSADPWRIGSLGLAGYYYKGLIDEVAMWNSALSGAEVAWLARNSLAAIPWRGTMISLQ